MTDKTPAMPEFIRVLVKVQGGEMHSTEAQFMSEEIGYLVGVPREWQPAALQSAQPAAETALQKFVRLKVADEVRSPLEQLRSFCSFAMSGQDWIDCEPFFDSIVESAQPVAAVSDEWIQDVATQAVREGRLSWLGFNQDDQGAYTIPVLSLSHFQFARAILALRPQAVPMTPEPAAYFSYGDDSGYLEHATAEAASQHAKEEITVYREDAMRDNEWPSEVNSVCWGVVLQKATAVDNSAEAGQESFDYELAPHHGITQRAAAEQDATVCQVPPFGWRCTRKAGHDGPCAAVETDDAELVQRGMARLRRALTQRADGGEKQA